MEVPVAKYLNGGRVAILKMHIPRADYSMGIRTIAAAVPRSQTTSPVLLSRARSFAIYAVNVRLNCTGLTCPSGPRTSLLPRVSTELPAHPSRLSRRPV
eukprot:COSAG03_NODE_21195_length_307_cov_1.240385_1_plen_98_part_01